MFSICLSALICCWMIMCLVLKDDLAFSWFWSKLLIFWWKCLINLLIWSGLILLHLYLLTILWVISSEFLLSQIIQVLFFIILFYFSRCIPFPNFFLTFVPIRYCSVLSAVTLGVFWSTLLAACSSFPPDIEVLATLGYAAASFLGEWNISVIFLIASFDSVSCRRNIAFDCRCLKIAHRYSSVTAGQSSGNILGVSTCLGKKSTVAAMRIPPVSWI